MKKVIKSQSHIKTKVLIYVCICILSICGITSLSIMASELRSVTCIHEKHETTTETRTEYSHNINSYCEATVEYVHHHCKKCGAEWTTTNNLQTISHNWKRVSSVTTGRSYSHQVSSYCYQEVETITWKCSNCGDTKAESNNKTSAHSWREIVDHYDGTYSYLKTECQMCQCVKSTRKVKGYVESGLGFIEKEENQ